MLVDACCILCSPLSPAPEVGPAAGHALLDQHEERGEQQPGGEDGRHEGSRQRPVEARPRRPRRRLVLHLGQLQGASGERQAAGEASAKQSGRLDAGRLGSHRQR